MLYVTGKPVGVRRYGSLGGYPRFARKACHTETAGGVGLDDKLGVQQVEQPRDWGGSRLGAGFGRGTTIDHFVRQVYNLTDDTVQPSKHFLLDTPVFDDISVVYLSRTRILSYREITE